MILSFCCWSDRSRICHYNILQWFPLGFPSHIKVNWKSSYRSPLLFLTAHYRLWIGTPQARKVGESQHESMGKVNSAPWKIYFLTCEVKVFPRMSSTALYRRCAIFAWLLFRWIGRIKTNSGICFSFPNFQSLIMRKYQVQTVLQTCCHVPTKMEIVVRWDWQFLTRKNRKFQHKRSTIGGVSRKSSVDGLRLSLGILSTSKGLLRLRVCQIYKPR